jgi:hypothetical protein
VIRMSLKPNMIHLIAESSSTTGCHTRNQRQRSSAAVIGLGEPNRDNGGRSYGPMSDKELSLRSTNSR